MGAERINKKQEREKVGTCTGLGVAANRKFILLSQAVKKLTIFILFIV